MSQRHRLDNKYTAPKKGSLQEKIKLAEDSIVNEANSQRFKGIGICAMSVSADEDDTLLQQRQMQLSQMSAEQKKSVLAQQQYVKKNFQSGGTMSKAEIMVKHFEDENRDKGCNTRQSVQFAGHLGRVKGEYAKTVSNPDEDMKFDKGPTSEQRSQEANEKLNFEIWEICDTIKTIGLPDDDGGFMVEFSELFDAYSTVSSQTVGLLIRARRRGFVHFEGETLLKGKDDMEIVTLLSMPPKPWE